MRLCLGHCFIRFSLIFNYYVPSISWDSTRYFICSLRHWNIIWGRHRLEYPLYLCVCVWVCVCVWCVSEKDGPTLSSPPLLIKSDSAAWGSGDMAGKSSTTPTSVMIWSTCVALSKNLTSLNCWSSQQKAGRFITNSTVGLERLSLQCLLDEGCVDWLFSLWRKKAPRVGIGGNLRGSLRVLLSSPGLRCV